MPTSQLAHVSHGDLITADQWNLMVDAVNFLLQPINQDQARPKVSLSVPAGTTADPIRVGTSLQILGQNFGYALGLTTVSFIGPTGRAVKTASDLLTGSSDSRLVLTVPPIPGLSATGDDIILSISNGLSADSKSVFAQLIVTEITGDVFVNWRSDIANPSPNPIATDTEANFAFKLQAATNLSASFVLNANLLNASATIPPGLISSIEFRNESGSAVLEQKSVELHPGEIRNILVRIPKIPANWNGVSFTLVVTATAGKITNTDSRTVKVGSAVAPVDPAITAKETGHDAFNVLTGADETNPTNAVLESNTIKLRQDRQMVIYFNVTVNTKGTYSLTMLAKTGTSLTGWAPGLVNSPATITADQDNNGALHPISIGVTTTAGASPAGIVVFRIKRQGTTMEWTKEYNVQLLS